MRRVWGRIRESSTSFVHFFSLFFRSTWTMPGRLRLTTSTRVKKNRTKKSEKFSEKVLDNLRGLW
jgi:hypothetical protein